MDAKADEAAWKNQAVAIAQAFLNEEGDEPVADSAIRAEVDASDREHTTPLLAAFWAVGRIRDARMMQLSNHNPRPDYKGQEKRVAEYLALKTGIGAGMDPIGFVLASHAMLAHERKALRAEVVRLGGDPDRLAGDEEPGERKAASPGR